MPTPSTSVNLIYLQAYDGQTPKVGVETPSPFNAEQMMQDTIFITEPEILAKIEELHAMVAETKGLTRPNAPQETPTNGE